MRRLTKLFLTALTIAMVSSLLGAGRDAESTTSLACCSPSGVVDKAPCGSFTVEISFKNTGTAENTWSVNIVFEGEKWVWIGTEKELVLKPDQTKTLRWNGTVPCTAPVDSTARLIVYYDDLFKPLDWWIHVVPGAELAITSSIVK
jgi:hypothetical protein